MFPPSTTQPPPATFGAGIHHATPVYPVSARTTEAHLVECVLQMFQGFPSSLFNWDPKARTFALSQSGTYLPTLSLSSLHNLVARFVHAATCLKLVEVVVGRLGSCEGVPTLRAFASSASQWLQKLRGVALKEELKVFESPDRQAPTLLGVSDSLSSLCSGAECLLQIVDGAVPQSCFEPNSGVSAAEIAVYILDFLYKKLDEVCHVQYGEEAAYQMVLHMFVGSVFPCIQGLDSWLFEGMLDDPFEEMFFYANKAISVDEPEFWEKSYQLRQVRGQNLDITPIDLASERDSTSLTSSRSWKELKKREIQVCPVFLKEISNSVVSAGKSLQLIRHVYMSSSMPTGQRVSLDIDGSAASEYLSNLGRQQECKSGLTLSEIFCLSVVGLIGHGDHISRYFAEDEFSKSRTSLLTNTIIRGKNKDGSREALPSPMFPEKTWFNFFVDTLKQKRKIANKVEIDPADAETEDQKALVMNEFPFKMPFCSETPAITVSHTMLANNPGCWKALNLSRNFHLPPLNDEALREAVFGTENAVSPAFTGTNYSFGFQFCKSEHLRLQDNLKMLESLFPFPTLLPPFQENVRISELLPFQKNNTLMSRVLDWLESVKPRITPLPAVIMHECLIVYVKEQVDTVGRVILSKLMKDWRLIDELALLRAIYLLGSGDLLQHFLTIIFNKLDKGETWDDDFELNTMLQESIRNSADAMLLSSPHSLVVSISQPHGHEGDQLPNTPTLTSTPCKGLPPSFGIDGLESLTFTYEVPWPLELIANKDIIKKYNQVMRFLLKVKRAKFVLDKARRWMWKGRRNATNIRKDQWLLEQKLLHFVDAFHQYVMDRVYHSAWRELCEGMAAAGSLDEVIEVHEAYLLSIQRQCFVVPDKLCTLIGNRVNTILGLALEFYSIQQTLSNGGAASAMKSRCEEEINRIEKQFDDSIAFLLRVLSPRLNASLFPHVADLVTRINYNYFYMSDSGSLMMATSSEVLRPGKAFRVRKD